MNPSYEHTQRGALHLILVIVAAALVAGVFIMPSPGHYILLAVAALLVICSFSFMTLTVRDREDRLELFFGPIPIFRKTIPYADMTEVREGRSKFIDGWGIHYVPGRGWIYNLWGFDCVEIALGAKRIRVGTDEPSNLAEFLRTKVAA